MIMQTTTIRVTEDLRDDLNLLLELKKKSMDLKSIDNLIRSMLNTLLYNEEFFERIRETVEKE